MAFADLLFTPGQDNLAGLAGEAYICPTDDILSVPALAVAGGLTSAAAAIVNKTGKLFFRIYMTDETGKVESKIVGERDGKAVESIFTMKHPGDAAAVAQFVRDWQNTPCVIIFKDAKTGLFKLLGVSNLDKASTVLSLTIPAYMESGDMMSGEKRADSRGVVLAWKFTCAHPPITYMSTIPLTPGA